MLSYPLGVTSTLAVPHEANESTVLMVTDPSPVGMSMKDQYIQVSRSCARLQC